MVSRRLGLRDRIRPEMLLGTIIEEAVVGLLMESAPPPDQGSVSEALSGAGNWVVHSNGREVEEQNSVESCIITSLDELTGWLVSLVPAAAEEVLRLLRIGWDAAAWKDEDRSIDEFSNDDMEMMLKNGVRLQIDEAKACLEDAGGPWLGLFRSTGDPFTPVAPRWGSDEVAVVAASDAANGEEVGASGGKVQPVSGWRPDGDQVTWWEAWEVSRPWMKDPRIAAPQRLHHPDGWASGEMDVVHRWRRQAVIVDIKSGRGNGRDHSSLEAQIGFYDWLWGQTRGGSNGRSEQKVERLSGWYLKDCYRYDVEALTTETLQKTTEEFSKIRSKMLDSDSDAWGWLIDEPLPPDHPLHCPHCSGHHHCAWTTEPDSRPMQRFVPLLSEEAMRSQRAEGAGGAGRPTAIADLPRRVTVRGNLAGWLENQDPWGETVRISSIRSGTTSVVVEEAEPGVVTDDWRGDVIIVDAAPGAHRGKARLFVDSSSTVHQADPSADAGGDLTRLGLLPTRATVAGRIVSRGGMSGVGRAGRPWSFESMHLWDGSGLLEIVAFGRDRTRSFSDLVVGDDVRIEHASMTWRDGAPQLSIDARATRIIRLAAADDADPEP